MSIPAIEPLLNGRIVGSRQNYDSGSAQSSGEISSESFSATLAKINGEMMALQALSSNGTRAGSLSFGGSENGSGSNSGVSQTDMSLLSSLLSSVKASVTRSVANTAVSSLGDLAGKKVVETAAKYIGTPYLWGGTSPSGFDCSGFTQYVYAKLGIKIPRTSEQQALMGTPVDGISNAQPGDLVFFAGSDGTAQAPGHVGIYVGNGEMINAPYTGTNVRVEPVADAGNVVEIRRLVGSAQTAEATKVGDVMVPNHYLSTVVDAANAAGIPASLLAALLSEESGFNPSALSSAGAVGIAQFMPATAAGLGVNPYDPASAINGAANLIASYVKQFGSYADALAAYNSSSGAVEKYGGIPPYPETQAYVKNVLTNAGITNLKGVVK